MMISRTTRGVFFGVVSAASYGLILIIVHVTSSTIPASEAIFLRSALGVCVLLPAGSRQRARLLSRAALVLWVRSITASIAIYCFTWNLQHTSPALATALFNAAPILIPLLDWDRSLGYRFKTFLASSAVVLGVICLRIGTEFSASPLVWIIGLISALGSALSASTLKMATKNWNADVITWVFCVTCSLTGLALHNSAWSRPTPHNFYIFFSICVLGLLSQLLLVPSFRLLSTATATSIGTGSIIFGVGYEVLFARASAVTATIGCCIYLAGLLSMIRIDAPSEKSNY
jgi:drug/metabolite transporter (DMT)-like permease